MHIQDGTDKLNNHIDSFLMIGQSNMAGRGELGEVPDIRNPLCFMLRMGRWQPMSEPINPDRAIFNIRFHSGISLAASFADAYAKYYDKGIGLIPCADGGTTISQWMPGENLFDHAVMQCKLAMRTSTLKGILWHQGESDCNAENFPYYEEKFIKMILELRKQLGVPRLPVIIGELSEKIADEWGEVNQYAPKFNKRLPLIAEKIQYSTIVPACDLTLKADGIHFNSVSCREFGKRYFEAYRKTMDLS